MEYTIGFKIDENNKNFSLYTLVLTPDKKIGLLDYEPNRNIDKLKIKISLNDEYYTYEKDKLTIVNPFLIDNTCKEYKIETPNNYQIFKDKNERFKANELKIENDIVIHLSNNKNYENPTVEQSMIYLEDKYRFSSTGEAYHIINILNELHKLKYGFSKYE